jgi:hypothetical protein
MLAYFHIIAIVCVAVEMIHKRSVTAALGRTLVVIAQVVNYLQVVFGCMPV